MAVSITLVSAVSRGLIVVSDSLAFTTAIYNLLVIDAKSLLDQEVGSGNLPSNLYDRCHALFICHLWEMGDPSYGTTSYSTGDYSQGLKEPGQTIYSMQVMQIIAKWNQQSTPQAESSVQRADCDLGLMQTDPNTIPKAWVESGTAQVSNPWGFLP
jgi:hypothetical protein